MKHKDEGWGWMLSLDFFFVGMGAGMLIIGGLVDLFIGEGRTTVLGNFIGPALMAIGPGFLTLELGRPTQAWRVFMNPKAILTVGAWVMSMTIGIGFMYASFGIEMLPWSNGFGFVRRLLAVACVIFGVVSAIYPGMLLGRHKARPFWNGPGIISLFFLSSLVTGAAGHSLCGLVMAAPTLSDVLRNLPLLIEGLLGLQLLLWGGYIWVKRSGGTTAEATATKRWISGDLSVAFKVGVILCGTLLPMVLVLMSGVVFQGIGAGLVVLGGLIMRMLVVHSGEERTWLPGEQKYRSRLPRGDEAFLKAWNKK